MNGYERIHAALNGRQPDATPVMLHNFMMAAHEAGVPMSRFRREPSEIARSFIESVEKYNYDGITVDIDTATLAGAVGVPVLFPDDEPAVCHGRLLGSLAQVHELPPPDVSRYEGVQVCLEAVRLLKRYFGDEVYIRGNCDQAPFSLASAMRGSADWMMDIMAPENEEDANSVLEYATGATSQFIHLMSATGAHMLSNGDSPAGPSVVSPAIYRKFAFPYEKRVARWARHLGRPYLLHICGKTDAILPSLVATGGDAIELDYKTGAARAARLFARNTTFVGNIDPTGVLALGTPRDVRLKVRDLQRIFSGNPRFILNAGCAIPATTPPDNIRALIAAARGN